MRYYERYDVVPIWNFYQILEHNDVKYLLEDPKQTINKSQLEELTNTFHEIYNDRVKYLDDNKINSVYRIRSQYNIYTSTQYGFNNTIQILKTLSYKSEGWEMMYKDIKKEDLVLNASDCDKNNENKEQVIKFLERKLKGFNNKVRAFKIANKDFLKDPDENVNYDLERDVAVLMEVLPNQRIDIYRDSVKKYDAITKIAQDKIRKQNNERRNN